MGSFLQSRRPQYDSYGYMSNGGGRRGTTYQLHKADQNRSGPKVVFTKASCGTAVSGSDAMVDRFDGGPAAGPDANRIINRVKRLLKVDDSSSSPSNKSSQKRIHGHTALLLAHMFLNDDDLDTRLLSWKTTFQGGIGKNLNKAKDLGVALNNMGFEVSQQLDWLMSLFQPLSDYNNFILCWAFVERYVPKDVAKTQPSLGVPPHQTGWGGQSTKQDGDICIRIDSSTTKGKETN